MGRSLYALHSDNVFNTINVGVTVASGTVSTTYGVNYLHDGFPNMSTKFTTASGRLVFDLLAANTVQGVALFNTKNFSGKTLQFQGNATNAWGAPSFSTTITSPTVWTNGFETCSWVDLRTTSPNYRYFSLNVTDGGGGLNWSIGEIWIVQTLRTWPWLDRGTKESFRSQEIEHETDADIHLFYSRVIDHKHKLETNSIIQESQLTALKTLYRNTDGRTNPFLFIRNESVNDALLVRWGKDVDFANTIRVVDRYAVNITLEKVTFGIPPTV